jgi:metal-sulfur cluster biosynthetic enzyme
MTEQEVLRVLQQVDDPEVGVNIVDLGLVYSIQITAGQVRITMTMTTPACPMHSYLSEEVRAAIFNEFEEAESVEVEIVWDPPWSSMMISDDGRRQLGWMA